MGLNLFILLIEFILPANESHLSVRLSVLYWYLSISISNRYIDIYDISKHHYLHHVESALSNSALLVCHD